MANLTSQLSHLTFSSQNCNSLNISTNCSLQFKKVAAILSLQTTIIFLSDIRLNTDNVGTNNFFSPGYEFFHNSSSSKRGVGILISSKLQYSVLKTYKDNANNILALRVKIIDTEILLVSVYGPNKNDNNFFTFLRHVLQENVGISVICAGDWNLTYCPNDADDNIDIINMLSPPSVFRSGLLLNICDDFDLIDPFRLLNFRTREYTYVPRAGTRNRSRIDFFLISENLITLCNKCSISPSLDTSLFDHKSIKLEFDRQNNYSKHFINPSIFKHARFNAVVATAAVETYLQHADPDQPGLDLPHGLAHLGEIINTIKNANEVEFEIAFSGTTQLLEHTLSGLNTELELLIQDLPDPELLNDIRLTCNADVFLEVLMGNIRNALISFQAWIRKVKGAKVTAITRNLTELKNNYAQNFDMISRLEQELCTIRDAELTCKIEEIKLFDNLHNERPSPLFLNLLKKSNYDSLSGIKGPDGAPFVTEKEREEYIVNFYSSLYKKRTADPPIDYSNCISNFLGPELVRHPIVQDSKISNAERELLDAPLTIEELDISLNNCNKKSAPGMDGFSNKLILRCWPYLRLPLFNYANHCFNTGILTHNFRSACIKLIPKKGDPSQLKNWRPISLLSNMYKIISRAINERLKKIVNRVCSRAQKGYNNIRYVQEVLINVCDTIAYCKAKNIRGSVLALDMAKAFDTLDHDFITEVYKFFGLGENIIRWLKLLGNEREACIILNKSNVSKYFVLGTGRPQGDNISPITFNFCVQILILKLELDPDISRIPRPAPAIVNNNVPFQHESNRETSTNESLADDNTVLSLITRISLLAIKKNIDEFAEISGLHCNYEKTSILPIHPLTNDEKILLQEVGFSPCNKIKLLGADISVDFEDITSNFNRCIEKIRSQVSFWSRFKLSLPGRIAIAKTFMLSQINYLGCVFVPTVDQLSQMQDIINNYIRRNLQISNDRIFLPPADGGIGIPNLTEFLHSQRCTWLLRAVKLPVDNWRYDLHMLAPRNNPLLIRCCDIPKTEYPTLFGIVRSYETFIEKFSASGSNYVKAVLFENGFFRDSASNNNINIQFFGRAFYAAHAEKIRSLTFENCFLHGNFKTTLDFQHDDLPLTVTTWFKLRNLMVHLKNSRAADEPGRASSMCDFVGGWKKGCKKIRKFFAVSRDPTESRGFITFKNLTNCIPIQGIDMKIWFATWTTYSLSNDLKHFIFSSRYNILPTNNRLHAYLKEIDPRCTLCVLSGNVDPPRDSFKHCFFDCVIVQDLISHILGLTGFGIPVSNPEFENLYWYGIFKSESLNKSRHLVFLLVFDCFRYVLFKNRLRKRRLTREDMLNEYLFLLKCIFQANKKLYREFQGIPELAILLQALG